MTGSTPIPDEIGAVICSRTGCTAAATWGMLWNNPRIHAPQRRKVWLTCDAHRDYFRGYLSSRGFLKQEVPVENLERKPGGSDP
jgi:hypothetical protein